MDDNEEDETLFADDLDDLPENAWDELEQNAIHLTQHPGSESIHNQAISSTNRHTAVYQRPAHELGDDQPRRLENQVARQQQHASRSSYLRRTGTDLYEDGHVATPTEAAKTSLPYHGRGELTQREEWRQERYGEASGPSNAKPVLHKGEYPRRYTANAFPHHSGDPDVEASARADAVPVSNSLRGQRQSLGTEKALKDQIADLIGERDSLKRNLDAAKSDIMTQKGEVAIIRANQAKDAKDFDQQIVALRESVQEGTVKHRHDIEATNRRSEKIANENQFLEHELKNEVEKIKALQKNLRAREAQIASTTEPLMTPRKTRQLPLRDGFDEEDVAVVSPSRSGRASKGGTPTHAGKRKRRVPEASPLPALTLRESYSATAKETDTAAADSTGKEKSQVVVRKDRRAQRSLRFMQRILNYRLAPSQDRILEVFSHFAFPSEPKRNFTSIVLEASATLSGETLPSGYAKIMIFLWAQALEEKYYVPISTLIRVVQYILALENSVMNSEVIQKIIPVLQSTTDVNGAVRFKNSPVSHQNFGQFKQTPLSELNGQVGGSEALDMLFTIACSCSYKPKLRQDFWRTVDSNFLLMMLNVAQPISDLTLTLNLLSTSILPTTFGIIMSNESDQQRIEHYLLNRVAYLLWETPRVDEGLPQPTRHQTYELRMEALSLLSQLALPFLPPPHNDPAHHGSSLLASHASLIGRLVRFIYDTVDTLYTPIEPTSPTHALLSTLINRATLLLYHLLQTHGKSINLHDKLSAVNGGVQKHRVVLTRLAFSEGLYLESGISDETVAMAHEMLEEAVTPEEAEALLDVFPGSGTAATTAPAPAMRSGDKEVRDRDDDDDDDDDEEAEAEEAEEEDEEDDDDEAEEGEDGMEGEQ